MQGKYLISLETLKHVTIAREIHKKKCYILIFLLKIKVNINGLREIGLNFKGKIYIKNWTINTLKLSSFDWNRF